MIPPGWNVTEPITLAAGLIRVIESLKAAPDDAKAFTAKIETFQRVLRKLQRVLERSLELDPHADHLDLRDTLADCQVFVQQCQRFRESFQKLSSDGTANIANAGQAARWVWNHKQIIKLRNEIDAHLNSVSLALLFKSVADEQERRGSTSNSGTAHHNSIALHEGPGRSQIHGHTALGQQACTPARLLGLSHYTELPYATTDAAQMPEVSSEPDSPTVSYKGTRLVQRDELATTPEMSELATKYSTQPRRGPSISSSPLRSPQLSSSPQEVASTRSQSFPASRVNTMIPSSPDSVSTWNPSFTFSPSGSAGTSVTDTTIDGRSRQGSLASLIPPSADMIMEDLQGVKMSYEKEGQRLTYPVNRIEILRDTLSRLRCIVVTPSGGYSVKFYQKVPQSERLLPHSEHFSAYGDVERRRVKFLQPHRLDVQYVDACTYGSSAWSVASMSPPKSCRSSIESQSSMRSSSRQMKIVSEHVEYEFGKEPGEDTLEASSVSWASMSSDYRRFQELIMGQAVQMSFHGPVQKITAKRSGALTCTTICERQNIRLWKYPSRHTLMFYANMSDTIKEYDLQSLRAVEAKSKTEIRLDVTLPKKSRQSSSSASLRTSNAMLVGDEAASIHDLGRNDLEGLSYIMITFSYAEDKTSFLQAVRCSS